MTLQQFRFSLWLHNFAKQRAILKSYEDLDLLLTSRDVDGVDLYSEILLFKQYLITSNNLLDVNEAQAINCIKDCYW